MIGEVDHGRRRFLSTAAMTIAAARLDLSSGGLRAEASAQPSTVEANQRGPRELAAHRRCGGVAQFPTPDTIEPRRQGGARGLLQVHLHQLAADAAIYSRLGAEVSGTARCDRRAHARVRIRKEPRERASCGAADADRVPCCDRQRLRDLAGLQEPILASPLLY